MEVVGDKSGWLYKTGAKNVVKVWKARYFVLWGSELYYFEHKPRSLTGIQATGTEAHRFLKGQVNLCARRRCCLSSLAAGCGSAH